jgi:hypothetical protein
VINVGYKSYGQLFYAKKPPVLDPKTNDYNWLLRGDIDKDVYVISKINRVHELGDVPDLQKLGEENGFVFFKREAVKR